MGAGSIRADRAVNPTLVFDETYDDFVAAGSDPLHRIDLNIASVDATTMTGWITTKRTAINVSGEDQDLEVSTAAPAGVKIIVSTRSPARRAATCDDAIHLKKNGTTDIWITISAPDARQRPVLRADHARSRETAPTPSRSRSRS